MDIRNAKLVPIGNLVTDDMYIKFSIRYIAKLSVHPCLRLWQPDWVTMNYRFNHFYDLHQESDRKNSESIDVPWVD